MPEHTFSSKDQIAQFEAEMAKRIAEAEAKLVSGDEHYRNFLARIQTSEAFHAEVIGKLKAVVASGYPLPIDEKNFEELAAILSLDTIGEPQVWPVAQ